MPRQINRISSIPIEKLIAHPDNPNRMSKRNLTRLIRNIERTGRYEPLVVRPCSRKAGLFQIINGRHRCEALRQLGHESVDAVVWDIDDVETDILLATLNRLGGRDVLEKKQTLLRRLSGNMQVRELARYLTQTESQIERLSSPMVPKAPAGTDSHSFANPMVFFVSDEQQGIIEKALSMVLDVSRENSRAAGKAAALTSLARLFSTKSSPKGAGRAAVKE